MKGVLFDFWGTLIENGVMPSPVRQARYIMKLKIPFVEYIVRFEEVFMTKKYEDLNEAFKAVLKEFDVEETQDMLEQLVGMWNKNSMLCKPFEETVRVLDDLKKNYKIGLVSNTPVTVHAVLEKFDLDKYFDTMALSFEKGHLKTNPKLFASALKDMGLKKGEVVMVGDSMETDIKGAEKAGIKAVLVDRRDRREYENKVTNLEQLKQFLED